MVLCAVMFSTSVIIIISLSLTLFFFFFCYSAVKECHRSVKSPLRTLNNETTRKFLNTLLRKYIFFEKKRITFWTAKYSSFLLTGVRIYAFKQFKSFVYTIFPFARILKELKNDIYAFLPSPRLGSCKLVGCIPALVYWALK